MRKLIRSAAAMFIAAAMCSGLTAYAADTYEITAEVESGSGSAVASADYAASGESVTFTAVPDSGYTFDHWDFTGTTYGYASSANVVFVIDTTTSMDDEIEDVKDNLSTLVQQLNSQGIGLNMSVITFSDYTHGYPSVYYTFSNGTHWTTDVDEVVGVFSTIRTGSGYRETPTDAFTQLVNGDGTLNFPSTSNNYIFLLTDEKNNDVDDPSTNHYTMDTWIDRFVSEGIKVSVVSLPKLYDSSSDDFYNLYTKTGGIALDINSSDYSALMSDFSGLIIANTQTISYTDNPLTVTVNGAINAAAVFTAVSDYTITVETNGHGTAYASKTSASEGELITITAIPETGYALQDVKCTYGGAVLADDYSFVMPASDVIIKVNFSEDTTRYLLMAKPYSYIFSYEPDMTHIKTNSNRKFDNYPEYVSITINLGEEYAGRTGNICKGRKSNGNVIESITLDENGCYVYKADIRTNYSFVLD